METIVNEYICRELIQSHALLSLRNDASLLEAGILDSLSVLKLMLFLEVQFGFEVAPDELIPENFESVDAICAYVRSQQHAQEAHA
jgi:acyl carrier protein